MILRSLILILSSIAFISFGQDNFNVVVSTAVGDLNKDGIADLVLVTQDTAQDNAPYKLEVFFTTSSGDKSLIVSTTKAIDPQYPNGKEGFLSGDGFYQVAIINGVLWIEMELLRGHFEHKFRFQNNHFELIGYTYVSSDGLGKMYFIDYNLSTGKRIEKVEDYASDEILEYTEKVVKLKELPKLEDFQPLMNKLY
ncbi:hypothetical protein K6119_00725 [Paracrocinitomix mangrovi]|uniref:hypothetical protein n=1 Tax=Paracrocinitomix mangrovi TaxID=2862509 RepID=UPI001C8D5236|nr:hypothetical protein [Paracrocinitomix mangrovi]UKN02037.1 hypothetical protein K6119_00725 [Paracrocinitomix mangrovi]